MEKLDSYPILKLNNREKFINSKGKTVKIEMR